MKRAVLVCIAAVVSACGNGGLEPKLSVIQQEIFTPKCALSGCHDTAALNNDLTLTGGNSHAELVGVESTQAPGETRVVAGDPGASVLAKVVENNYKTIPRMPSGGPFLDQSLINLIKDWIEAGAPND